MRRVMAHGQFAKDLREYSRGELRKIFIRPLQYYLRRAISDDSGFLVASIPKTGFPDLAYPKK